MRCQAHSSWLPFAAHLHTRMTGLAAAVLGAACVMQAQGAAAAVAIETVTIGNPGNPGEQSRLSSSDPTFYGGVAYTFSMGKYEVTAGQYTEFLNAVAATDTHNLYNPSMDHDANSSLNGCNIMRQGTSGSYTYSVAPDWADRPVNYVSWADAVRFANWLHNGQPTGPQNLTTTEDGSYFINGIHEFNDGALEEVVREPDATWVIPTDAEWYKSAYHKNDGVTGNYWNYPTSADSGVSNELIDPDPGNHATFAASAVLTIGAPYYRTEAGAHENSASPYGTFDQGGNVMEFTETVGTNVETRRMRGGSWEMARTQMSSSEIDDVMHSSDQFYDLGFRLAIRARPDVMNLRGFDSADTYFDWDPVTGESGAVYDLVRGELSNLSGDASGVGLGPLTCIEDDSPDETSQSDPDVDVPASGSVFFYVVRFHNGAVIGPWGFGSAGQERTGTGGCLP
jgi:formylglycine-generating enzyme required for sulfatase activity